MHNAQNCEAGDSMWEKIITFLCGMALGIVQGMILMAALERRRYEALARDVEEIAAANVFILDRVLDTINTLLCRNNGGAVDKNG